MSQRAALASARIPRFGLAWPPSHRGLRCFGRNANNAVSHQVQVSREHTFQIIQVTRREINLQVLTAGLSTSYHRFSENFLRLSNSHDSKSKIYLAVNFPHFNIMKQVHESFSERGIL